MPINDLSELIKAMGQSTGTIDTSVGKVTIYPFNVGDQSKLYSYASNDKNTETMAFYYLLSLICFPYRKKNAERPAEPIFDIEEVQLLNKKETFLIMEKSGVLSSKELKDFEDSPSYQSDIVRKTNKNLEDSLPKINQHDINSHLAWMNDTKPLLNPFDNSISDDLITRGDIEDSKEKRHEATMKLFADLVKHSKFTFGINAEILQKLERESQEKEKDRKTNNFFNYSILSISIIGALISLLK